jgi:hypothetical protein
MQVWRKSFLTPKFFILSTCQANVHGERVQTELYIIDIHVVNVSKMSSVDSTLTWLDEEPNCN